MSTETATRPTSGPEVTEVTTPWLKPGMLFTVAGIVAAAVALVGIFMVVIGDEPAGFPGLAEQQLQRLEREPASGFTGFDHSEEVVEQRVQSSQNEPADDAAILLGNRGERELQQLESQGADDAAILLGNRGERELQQLESQGADDAAIPLTSRFEKE